MLTTNIYKEKFYKTLLPDKTVKIVWNSRYSKMEKKYVSQILDVEEKQ